MNPLNLLDAANDMLGFLFRGWPMAGGARDSGGLSLKRSQLACVASVLLLIGRGGQALTPTSLPSQELSAVPTVELCSFKLPFTITQSGTLTPPGTAHVYVYLNQPASWSSRCSSGIGFPVPYCDFYTQAARIGLQTNNRVSIWVAIASPYQMTAVTVGSVQGSFCLYAGYQSWGAYFNIISVPSAAPTSTPTSEPSSNPSKNPSSIPISNPTSAPTSIPTFTPSSRPTLSPTTAPTRAPTLSPTSPTVIPTSGPSSNPSKSPNSSPTSNPTSVPSIRPTLLPTSGPTWTPTTTPTTEPTSRPTKNPSSGPTVIPTLIPTFTPTFIPTWSPTSSPTLTPTKTPTTMPTSGPTLIPTDKPSTEPSNHPSSFPTSEPTFTPTSEPSKNPTTNPSSAPTSIHTTEPSFEPSTNPTSSPSNEPTSSPTSIPTSTPTEIPTDKPSSEPTSIPSTEPTSAPTLPQTTLTTKLPSLGKLGFIVLSVKDPAHPALTGNPRSFKIINTGAHTAHNVSFFAQNSRNLPNPTINSNLGSLNSCGDIAPQETCTLIITPNATASSIPFLQKSDLLIYLIILGANTNTLGARIFILTYGSVYQDGLVYSIDDTQGCTNTSCEGSIGGKVISMYDQAAPCISNGPQPMYRNSRTNTITAPSTGWSSNGAWGSFNKENYFNDPSYDVIPGINELSSPCCGSFPSFADFQSSFAETYSNPNPFNQTSFNTCDGLLDGQCNSANIIKFYNQFMTDSYPSNATTTAFPGPTSLYSYAAGLCAQKIGRYNDWYLPAACEIAFDENFCPSGTQSVSVLKPLIGSYQVGEKIPGDQPLTKYTSCTAKDDTVGNIDCLAGNYWSSTQMATNSQKSAWPVMFDKELNLHGFFGVSCGKNTNSGDKANQYGVRCARNLTPTY